jgi:hypothetical protein
LRQSRFRYSLYPQSPQMPAKDILNAMTVFNSKKTQSPPTITLTPPPFFCQSYHCPNVLTQRWVADVSAI